MDNTKQDVIEMLEGLAFALNAAATLLRDGDYTAAITAAMATARLLEVTGPALCADAMTQGGLTLEAIDAALETAVVLTSGEDEHEAFPGITPEDFA